VSEEPRVDDRDFPFRFRGDLTMSCRELYPGEVEYKKFFCSSEWVLAFDGKYLSERSVRDRFPVKYHEAVKASVHALHQEQQIIQQLKDDTKKRAEGGRLYDVMHGYPLWFVKEEIEDATTNEDLEFFKKVVFALENRRKEGWRVTDYMETHFRSFVIQNWSRGLWILDNAAIQHVYKEANRVADSHRDAVADSTVRNAISKLKLSGTRPKKQGAPVYFDARIEALSVNEDYRDLFREIP